MPTAKGRLLPGVANPKAWVAIAAVYAGVELSASPTVDALVKTTVLTGLIVFRNTGWLLAGASLAPVLRRPRAARVFKVAMAGALLVATALTAAG